MFFCLLQDFGTLHLSKSLEHSVQAAASWADSPINKAMLFVSIVLILLEFTEILRAMPALLECVSLARANVSLEHSLSSSRSRNKLMFAMIIPVATVMNRFFLWPYQWMALFLFSFLLLRFLLYLTLPRPMRNGDSGPAARHVLFNFFIILSILLIPTAIILPLCGVPEQVTRIVIFSLAGLFYFLSLVRVAQILAFHCSNFSTFLYLCALEMIPTGGMIFSVMHFTS